MFPASLIFHDPGPAGFSDNVVSLKIGHSVDPIRRFNEWKGHFRGRGVTPILWKWWPGCPEQEGVRSLRNRLAGGVPASNCRRIERLVLMELESLAAHQKKIARKPLEEPAVCTCAEFFCLICGAD